MDERYLEVTNQPFDRAPSYVILNARLAVGSPDQRWDVALWGNNITDTDYLTYINNITFFTVHVYGEPASYGLTVSYRFR